MLLVKLGGSVVTEKTHLRTPRSAAIRRLAGELASLREPLLIVHGAGSYGHILARRHRLNEGGPTLPRRLAAAAVQADVRELDGLVVRALNRAGLAAIPIPPSAVLALDDGRVSTMDLTPFLEFASMEFTPVTFGDVVRDVRRGFSVFSGDLLMLELARAFRPKRAVFAADVDGLFTTDPKRRRAARLLETVGPDDLSRIEFSSSSRTDVTGSIEGKLRRMFEIADHAGECLIVNGNVKNRVRDALRGRHVVCTRVVRVPRDGRALQDGAAQGGTCQYQPPGERLRGVQLLERCPARAHGAPGDRPRRRRREREVLRQAPRGTPDHLVHDRRVRDGEGDQREPRESGRRGRRRDGGRVAARGVGEAGTRAHLCRRQGLRGPARLREPRGAPARAAGRQACVRGPRRPKGDADDQGGRADRPPEFPPGGRPARRRSTCERLPRRDQGLGRHVSLDGEGDRRRHLPGNGAEAESRRRPCYRCRWARRNLVLGG